MPTIKIDPVNRIEGHQQWEVDVTGLGVGMGNRSTSAKVRGMMFRGFEMILPGRDPRDAIIICGRI
jgi:Ni,Fe-hydrogenase I large subunit